MSFKSGFESRERESSSLTQKVAVSSKFDTFDMKRLNVVYNKSYRAKMH